LHWARSLIGWRGDCPRPTGIRISQWLKDTVGWKPGPLLAQFCRTPTSMQFCRTNMGVQGARGHVGRPQARWGAYRAGRTQGASLLWTGVGPLGCTSSRTHTRGVPTMDGRWVRGSMLRVSWRRGDLMAWSLDVAAVPASIPSPHAGTFASFLHETCANEPILVHSRDAPCVRPACLRTHPAITLYQLLPYRGGDRLIASSAPGHQAAGPATGNRMRADLLGNLFLDICSFLSTRAAACLPGE
jgi:hypothetical protein